VLLVIAVAAFVFFYDSARRHPDDRLGRTVFSSGRNLRGWGRFGLASSAAWVRAARNDVRLRRESRSLRREREPILAWLGDAVYREDEPLVKTLRERVHEIDGELAKRQEARAEALSTARRHVGEEREAARATQQFDVEDLAAGKDSDEK